MIYHEHPLRILRYSAKNIWLLVFPLFRGMRVIRLDADRLYQWFRGAWLDIAVIGVIILFGYIRWHFSGIQITDTEIIYREGISAKIRTSVPFENVSSVTVERPFYLMLLRAVKIGCDTSGGISGNADLRLMVTEKFSAEFLRHLPEIDDRNKSEYLADRNTLSVLLFSVFFSSGFSGAVYIATFFFKGGDIAHDIINVSLERITETTTRLGGKILLGIPSVAIAVGIFFLSAWLVSFLMNIFRYFGFTAHGDEYNLKISCGLFNRREYRITSAHINYTDLRQNLIMKFLGTVAVNISCAGYGSAKNHLPVLLPVGKEKNIGKTLGKIGIFGCASNEFRPQKNGWWQYIWKPVITAVMIFPLHIVTGKIFPDISELTFFFSVMSAVPLLWFLTVGLTSFLTSGVSFCDSKIMLRCSKGTDFHTVVAERSHIVKVGIRQTVFQQMSGKCTLLLWIGSEERSHFSIKSLKLSDAVEICKMLDYNINECF